MIFDGLYYVTQLMNFHKTFSFIEFIEFIYHCYLITLTFVIGIFHAYLLRKRTVRITSSYIIICYHNIIL
ncbi:hypothetical protein C1645_753378 [Glomus cerebriforme]|uniref:Uncharacterized protein n=1 Tax=Glomus cerebriforme TaxID=658196 RepID=A0A397TJL8_9GLOM|nr:hypothetical protein C1645_753378 [Glomus cerebriforme]